ncbi:hypothetical protein QTV49_005259, partial [Vibrio vulnificus]|nr:hypothetical protein [Vibrio vulnificus]
MNRLKKEIIKKTIERNPNHRSDILNLHAREILSQSDCSTKVGLAKIANLSHVTRTKSEKLRVIAKLELFVKFQSHKARLKQLVNARKMTEAGELNQLLSTSYISQARRISGKILSNTDAITLLIKE